MAYKTLERWLEEMLSIPDRKLTALACFYELPTGGTKEVHTEQLTGKTWPVEVLYNMFKGVAETFVQEKQGNHTFEMRAFFDNKNTHDRVHPFSVIDGEIRHGGANRPLTEHPNQTGHLAQMMRHVETAHQLNTQLVQTMAATWMQERRERIQDETRMRAEVNDAYGIVREMMMRISDNEHTNRMKEMEFKRASEERKMMIDAAPSLINAISGKEVISQDKADTMLIDAMASRIGPDQVKMLIEGGFCPPELAGVLTARLAQAREKKRVEAEELKKLPAGETGNVTSIVKKKGSGSDSGAAPVTAG
jgi:hypothetical protein